MNGKKIDTGKNFEDLIISAQKGDKNSFRLIVEMHKRFAYAVAYKILLNEEEAKDAAQESFIKLWHNLNSYKFEAKFTTWFYKIVINKSLDKLKSRKRKEEAILTGIENSAFENLASKDTDDFSGKELKEIIEKLTGKLSPKQKLVFTLRDLNGFEIEEISGFLNISEGSVKTNLVYARRRIKELLTTIYKWQ